ncbi:MAG: DUF1849 family protein [Alphaproteobacteria bacterium]
MTHRHMLRALALLAALTGTPAGAANLVPHEARFALSLVSMGGAEAVASAGGEMVFRIEQACTGWTVLSRMVFGVALDAQHGMRIESLSGLTESSDGRTLTFEHQTSLNGQPSNVTRGTATVGDGNGAGRALYTLPDRVELTLPKGTVLPVAATEATLAAFSKGQKLRSYVQFDGQNADGPVRISEVVGGKPRPLSNPPKGDVSLLNTPLWRISTSFFGLDADSIEPIGVQTSEMHANGIIQRLQLDIDTMTVEGELIEIKALPAKPC